MSALADDTVGRLVRAALAEDVGPGDWTTLWTVLETARGRARIVAREALVVAGTGMAAQVFRAQDETLGVELVREEGENLEPGDVVLTVEGPTRSILTAERTALNCLGRLSGIATLTRRFVREVQGTGARIVDTRKTTPGWRQLEKAAVRAGGGENHRMGLFDMVLVKENHIAAAGGVAAALERVRVSNREGLPVEVEVRSVEELEEALPHAPDRILLDNMALETLGEAVARVRGREGRPLLEASGNVSISDVRRVAATGVDLISVGALTHSAPVADLSLLLDA